MRFLGARILSPLLFESRLPVQQSLSPFQIESRLGNPLHIPDSSLLLTPLWPFQILSDPVAAAVVRAAVAVAGPVAEEEGRAAVELAVAAAEQVAAPAERVVEEKVVRVEGPAAGHAEVAQVAAGHAEVARVAAGRAAAECRVRISTIPLTASRGPSCRLFRLLRPPISRFWLLWRKEPAASPFLTPTICSEGSRKSGASKMNFTFWDTHPEILRKEVATRSR